MKIIKNTFIGLYKNPFYLSIIIGLIFLVIGYTDAIFEANSTSSWINLFRTIGTLNFSGGIFVALVKSDQFTSIFGDEIRKIVYSDDHLEKRNDLEEIWEKVSKALYQQKFKSISKDLHQNIREYYLPIDHDFYYKDYSVDLDIEFDPINKGYIIINEETRTLIVSDDEKKKICYTFAVKIPIPKNDNNLTFYELTELSVNGNIIKQPKDLKITKTNNLLSVDFKSDCVGRSEHTIIRKEKKRYHLGSNPYRGHLAVWLYKNFKFEVNYPKELEIEWIDIGVVNNWTRNKKETNGINQLKANYNGLIFKKQGFMLFFKNINI